MKPTDSWLKLEIRDGLMRLAMLNLRGRPAMSDLPQVAQIWLESICRRAHFQPGDAPRVRAGFAHLIDTAEEFPLPADLLRAIPPPEPAPRLNPPPLTPEEKAQNLRQIRRIIEDIQKSVKKI